MNSRECIITALELKEPDRVPIFELGINEPSILNLGKHFTDNLPPLKHVYDMTVEEQLQYMDLLALILGELGNDGISTVFIINKERTGEGDLVKDRYGTTFQLSDVGEPLPVAGPIDGPKDLHKITDMMPHPEDYVMLRYLIAKMGEEVAHFFTIPGPFRFSWQLRGAMEKLLLDFMRAPDFCLDLIRITTDFSIQAIEMAAEVGADVVALEGDLAFNTSTLISPDQYRKFLKPYHAKIVEASHRAGMKIIKHSDGNLWPIMDDMIEIGFDGIHPIQPQSMDIEETKAKLAGRTAVLGNIDCSFLLPFGTEEEVDRAVRETIKVAAPGGGYIISSSNSIHPGVKAENYIAMVKATHEYGAYPINL